MVQLLRERVVGIVWLLPVEEGEASPLRDILHFKKAHVAYVILPFISKSMLQGLNGILHMHRPQANIEKKTI